MREAVVNRAVIGRRPGENHRARAVRELNTQLQVLARAVHRVGKTVTVEEVGVLLEEFAGGGHLLSPRWLRFLRKINRVSPRKPRKSLRGRE